MNEHAMSGALGNRALTKASQVLTGIVTGIVADGQLNDLEVQMLSTWLGSNSEVVDVWPGSAIARLVREVLEDGIITEEERLHLLVELQRLVGMDFAQTGSVEPGVVELPYDDDAPVAVGGRRVCFTGEFVFGTRAACQRAIEKLGGTPVAAVSKKVDYLIVGTHVSPDWVNTSYGQKIMRAMELRDEGHAILVIRERRWIESLGILA